MLKASHGLNLRVDVREELVSGGEIESDFFVDLVCVGIGANYALKTWEVTTSEAIAFADEPAELAAFVARRFGAALS